MLAFSVHAPATTEIYTLSLHDALPILRDQLGLRNARWCLTGGAPLGADTFRFFRSFGVNLKQIYGATEASALVALQDRKSTRLNSSHVAIPYADFCIKKKGEVQVKGYA